MAEACHKSIIALLQDYKHSWAIWHLKVGSFNWILMMHCTVWYHHNSKETHSAYTLKTAAFAKSQSVEQICSFFSKGCQALCYLEKKKKDNKSKCLGFAISASQRRQQLGDRCVNSPATLLNTKQTLIWVCSWKSFTNPSPRRKWSH